MPTPLLHESAQLKLTYGGGPTTLYCNQVDQVDVQSGIELLEAMGAGSVDPLLIATAFAENKVSLTCRDVATILGGISATVGLSYLSATAQWQKRLGGGVYTSGSNHITMTSTGGLIYPKEITAKQDDKEGASITLEMCPVWDGTNLPLVVNSTQAMAGSAAANSVHALGPVIFEGAQLGGVQSVSVKTGIEVKFLRQDGELYPRIVCIVKRKPMIEIELINVPFASTLSVGLTTAISTGITCYMQKVVPGGGRVAVGTAEHISFSTIAGAYKLENVSGSKHENGTLKLSVHPTGTLSMSAATAIVIP